MVAMDQGSRIYHITHGANLKAILAAGGLRSDARMAEQGGPASAVGMPHVKERRRTRAVPPHPSTRVGDYVPFYFCPRSVMLFILHRSNHPELSYSGGQRPMLHLVASIDRVVAWAERNKRAWAFTSCNAAALYAEFYASSGDLARLDWDAIRAPHWADPAIKEAKQAEFLVHGFFPWELIEEVGAIDQPIARRVEELLQDADHRPQVSVRPDWYYE